MTIEVHKVVRVGDGVAWYDQTREQFAKGRVTETLYGQVKCLENGRPLQQEQTVDLDQVRVVYPIVRDGDVVRLTERDQDEYHRVPEQGKVVRRHLTDPPGSVWVLWESGKQLVHQAPDLERVPISEQHPNIQVA